MSAASASTRIDCRNRASLRAPTHNICSAVHIVRPSSACYVSRCFTACRAQLASGRRAPPDPVNEPDPANEMQMSQPIRFAILLALSPLAFAKPAAAEDAATDAPQTQGTAL